PARRGAGPQPVTGPRRHLRGRDPLRTLRPAARGSADAVRLRARTRWPRRDTARHRRTDRSHARGRCADARGPVGGSEGMSQVMIREAVPQLELLDSGHLACPGCGAPLAMRLVLKELGEKTVVVLPACCWSIIAGPYPQSSLHVPLHHTAFATGAATASGVRAALDARGDTDTTVMVWAGDGGTFDIGLQALSGAAERNENILYVCYDNEAYMNTGIQRSSATPWGAWTTT